MIIIILFIGIVALGVYIFAWPQWRRRLALRHPFPQQWRRILEQQVPLYRHLPWPLQSQLEQHVQLFVAEKPMYGCDGFRVTDPVRLTIAGHACMLITARSFSDFDAVRAVLVYPGVYRVRESVSDGFVQWQDEEFRAGESWDGGRVVLSWEDCQAAAENPDGPHNVILHEFAHQLDHAGGETNGAPGLGREAAVRWQRVMRDAYERLGARLEQGEPSWLDPYGMTHPAEFFAVLSEAFFQQPHTLQREEPAVYAELCGFYRISPAEGYRPVR